MSGNESSGAVKVSTLIDWRKCLFCKGISGNLQCPALSKRKDNGAGYRTLVEDLLEFEKLGQLPLEISLETLDDGTEDARKTGEIKVHKLSSLVKEYSTRLAQLGAGTDQRVHQLAENKLTTYLPGLSAVSNGREGLKVSADLGNLLSAEFEATGIVCPLSLRKDIFTTMAVDNIDHNPSSATAADSFHGTAISVIQHPLVGGEE
eukprot:gene16479-18117_t